MGTLSFVNPLWSTHEKRFTKQIKDPRKIFKKNSKIKKPKKMEGNGIIILSAEAYAKLQRKNKKNKTFNKSFSKNSSNSNSIDSGICDYPKKKTFQNYNQQKFNKNENKKSHKNN